MERLLPFHLGVFINCPFDTKYRPILEAVTFTVFDCGFVPRCALEDADFGQERFSKIVEMLKGCKYSIHDISRVELDLSSRLPRFNMPLELGVELGLRNSGNTKMRQKKTLVMDKERYRYQKYISDIAGRDPQAHKNHPEMAIQVVRNWLRTASDDSRILGSAAIVKHYRDFRKQLPTIAARKSLQTNPMLFVEYANAASDWLKIKYPPQA
ncbi:MAG: hypothetical protein HY922_04500 [Elusimicrobia bacterium]|nr:hypothetical protein [Elusimicrobiota bacterium]